MLFTAGDDMTIRAWALQDAPVAPNPTSPTLKPPHPPALNIVEASERKAAVGVEGDPGTRFTCFTGIKVQMLTQKTRVLCCNGTTRTPTIYSIYLLYWYKSANADAEDACFVP